MYQEKTKILRIGTRKSPLALWQAEHVRDRLMKCHPGLLIDLVKIETKGDKILDSPLAMIGDKGLFTREIERALIDNEVDLAVHSLKDLPTRLPDGLILAVVSEREDPRDVLVAKTATSIATLPENATVATSSLRRRSQLLHARPDLNIVDVRGNVGTRMNKFDAAADWEAMIMAHAGLLRMKMDGRISAVIEPSEMLPAVSQGALGIEIRTGDAETAKWIAPLEDPDTRAATTAERAFLHRLEGGCQIPIGALATVENHTRIMMEGVVASLDGKRYFRERIEGNVADAEGLGIALGEHLLRAGANLILESIRNDG